MSETDCEKCGLDLSGRDGKASLARCKDAECPIEKPRSRILMPVLAITLVSGLVIAGTAAGVSMLAAPPDKSAKEAATAARVAAKAKAEALRNAPPVKVAKDGGTGIATDAIDKQLQPGNAKAAIEHGPPFKGPLPLPDAAAMARVASFSCATRSSAGRAIVCSDMQLAISDYNLTLLYKSAMVANRNRAQIRKSQTEWLARLDRFGNDKQRVAALYRERFDQLSLIQAGVG